MYCPYCGKSNEDGSVFCEHCGKSLVADLDEERLPGSDWDDREDRPDGEPQLAGGSRGGGKKAALIAVAVVAVVVVAILVAVFATGAGGGGEAGTQGSSGAASEEPQSSGADGGQEEEPAGAKEHRIVFETSGGTTYEPLTAATGDVVTSPTEPVKNNAAFEGWYSDQGLTMQVSFPYTVKDTDPETIILYAKWDDSGSGLGNGGPFFPNCKASSQLPGDDKAPDYGPYMARDGDLVTAWNEGAPNDGVGEWIQLEAPEKQKVSGLRIATGFQKTEEIYSQNRRPRDITISFEDGTTYNALLDDALGYQIITFNRPVETRIVRITINSTYKGKYFDDCCISEVEEF